MYGALLRKPDTITEPLMLYSPSAVLSRQKKAGLTVRDRDFESLNSVDGCNAIKLRRAKSSA
jgi:hypothetical protein